MLMGRHKTDHSGHSSIALVPTSHMTGSALCDGGVVAHQATNAWKHALPVPCWLQAVSPSCTGYAGTAVVLHDMHFN
jgi:hypothetical protein